ncbi:hypothetical protein QMU05_000304 [Escherichia coli]|nr:hypothetical protein [Escherichia coli]
MIKLKFEGMRDGNGNLIITRGTKAVRCLEEHGIEFTIPYDDIRIKEDTVLELPLTTFEELNAFCQTYNALITFDERNCVIEFLQH